MSLTDIYHSQISAGTLTADPAQAAVIPMFEQIAVALNTPVKRRWFQKNHPPNPGLYLWGGVGRGKSMLMDLFAQNIPKGVRRVHFHAFMQDVHAAMAAARATGADDAIIPVAAGIAQNLRCLAFDELQITDITDAMIVGRLFEQLFAHGVTIVATSNRPPNDLYKDGLNRALFLPFIDLIKEKMVVHELASPHDYRQNRLKAQPLYFYPLGPAAQTQMDDLWADLAGGNGGPLQLTVNGRTVDITHFRNGVGRGHFADLCGKPLGPADYLAIAQAVKVLLIDDVPLLGTANNNEAKRFVTLIDTLYEARVKLALSAAARPDALYPKGAGSFEFERTASRLHEMQSADWGGG